MTGIATILFGAACIWTVLWISGVTLQVTHGYEMNGPADWIASIFISPPTMLFIFWIEFFTMFSVNTALENAQQARNEEPAVPEQTTTDRGSHQPERAVTDESDGTDDGAAGLDLDTDTGFPDH
jgi:hypothetical protein